ncbi:MAG: amidase family protein [Acidobacteriota bacterium]|nr:amidase family protein [Acidobacteriota bacterium]
MTTRQRWSQEIIFGGLYRWIGTGVFLLAGCAGTPPEMERGSFDVMERSIRELANALDSGEVTSRELVDGYLARIDAYDRRGPRLNAMVVVNPNARLEADRLDTERAAGRLSGPLHGIPVVVKDNYDTADMPTSAGAIGLATSIPADDATQVRRLREAGAIVLGKTNMHELARGITTVSSNTGQTRNPYNPARNPGGSSGGTGAAVAASFAAVGMGSDTCGSIRIPSAHHALVGLRGTRGFASGDGIIPLSTTQDIGGPLARTVEDLALTLDATAGFDPADEVTRRSEGRIPATFLDALNIERLRGTRVALLEELLGDAGAEEPVREVIEAAAEELRMAGAEVVEIEDTDLTALLTDASVIGLEFRSDFDANLAKTPGAPIRSLAQLVGQGLFHEVVDSGLRRSLEVETLDTDEYRARIAKRDVVRAAVETLLDEHDLTALLYPTIRRTARPIGERQPGSNCALSAISGLPAITVPAGYAEDGMPVGLEMIGREFAELDLIGLAYAYEQATSHRRSPHSTPSLLSPPPPVVMVPEQVEDGLRVGGKFVAFPSRREVRYDVTVSGVAEPDILFTHVHRSHDGQAGPVVYLLGGVARAHVRGVLDVTARDWQRLRGGELYVDVHTTTDLPGVRATLQWPDEDSAN